jgi:hypothetical protein
MSSKNPYPWFFFFRTARLIFVIFLPVLLIVLFLFRLSYKESLFLESKEQGKVELALIQDLVVKSGISWKEWCKGLRPTPQGIYALTSIDGKVLCDNLNPSQTGSQLQENNLPWSEYLFVTIPVGEELLLQKGTFSHSSEGKSFRY